MNALADEYEVVGGCDCCEGRVGGDYPSKDSAIRAARTFYARLVQSGHRCPWVVVYDKDGFPPIFAL